MSTKFYLVSIYNKLLKKFLSLDYIPRWVIFLIDLSIVLLSSMLTFFIVNGLTIKFYDHLNLTFRIGIILFFNAFYFLIFKTYSGIIRHSTYLDGVKLLLSSTCAFSSIVFLNYLYLIFFDQKIYLTTTLFITYVISFLLLFLFRILVKFLFEIYSTNIDIENKLLTTFIYGSDANAISVANALKAENPMRFKLVGFIDKNNSNHSAKRILNLPLFNHNLPLNQILKKLDSNVLIIAEKNLTKSDRITIVEECLENDIKVFTVPVIANWEDSNQISKKVTNFNIEDLLDRKPIILDTESISNQIIGKTILITGAAGSIGSEITRQAFGFNPYKIIILDQAETPLHHLRLELNGLESKVKIRNILADIRDYESLENIFKFYKPDIVYHAAAYKHVPIIEENPIQAIYTNVIGTKNLADLSHKYKVQRFVMVSTDKAVNPSNVMGASKRIAEKYVQSLYYKNKKALIESPTKFITTRFGNVLGSNGSVVPLFKKQIQNGGPLTITHPEILRYFMTIPEACQLVLEACSMGKGGEIFIFDMGKPVKILDLAKKMIKLAGFIPEKDIKIEVIGLRPGEKLFEELLTDSSRTLATHNEKILIAEDVFEDFEVLNSTIEDLSNNSRKLSNIEIVSIMKKLVPEFLSQNSTYKDLDIL